MNVVILAGGAGTRMREETARIPKPMIRIGDRPILWHIMKIYAHYGFKNFVVCLGYKGEVIKDYFARYDLLNRDVTVTFGKKRRIDILAGQEDMRDWKVTLANTGERSLKGARVKRIEKYIKGDVFMLTYGDGLANIDLKALLHFHHRHGRLATLTGVYPPSRFGEMLTDGPRVKSFSEKPQSSSGLINGGFFVLNRKVFAQLNDRDDCDFERGLLERLAQDKQLMVYRHTKEWACMDHLRDIDHLNALWQNGRAFWKVW